MDSNDVELARQRVLAEFERQRERAEAETAALPVIKTVQEATAINPTVAEVKVTDGVVAADNAAVESLEQPQRTDQVTEIEAVDPLTPEAEDYLVADAEAKVTDLPGDLLGEAELMLGEDLAELNLEDPDGADMTIQLHDVSIAEKGLDSPEIETGQTLGDSIREHLAEYLEPLEESAVEVVATMAEAVVQTAREMRVLREAGEVRTEDLEEKLEELCIQMFEYLGIDYGEETIKTFLRIIKNDETQEGGEQAVEEFVESGTHESKLDAIPLLGQLIHMIKQELSPQSMLGRLALRFEHIAVRPEAAA